MNTHAHRLLAAAALLALLPSVAGAPAAAQTRLVNMIPQSWSGEQNQDAEPTLTVDPADYNRMAGAAFTWDNLTGLPATMVTATAPIYVSTDRGTTWVLALVVPSQAGGMFPTGDITLSFGSTPSGAPSHDTSWLYAGILRSTAAGRPMTVLRAQDYLDPALMAVLDSHPGNVDQPHTRAQSIWGQDRLYVGFNNGWGCGVPGGRTATLDVSQNGLAAVPTFSMDVIQARNTACQDGYAQVAAPHLDGTVYAAFIGDWTSSPRLVVVRDDSWGAGGTPFAALLDSVDLIAGQFVSAAFVGASGTMGQNRLGASNVSIAVDPRNSDRVYVAWGDSGGANSETIHVRRSITRGQTWSADLLTVTNAMNPQIAINSLGTVGVLYQRVVAGHWETRLTRTTDLDATVFDSPDLLLANTDATAPAVTYFPYIGDYASLIAAGKNFYGMFSASNYPDTAAYLPGVVFQRYVDWGTHTLYADAAHTMVVPRSIDPFFFEVDAIADDLDFYVRDWTTDAAHADPGAEPSTNPVFYATSDVWNRRNTMPGPFSSDQPTNEDAGNGAGNIGDNWAFARVRRNTGGTATSVTAHFLVSKFGTGSNYVDATSGDPDVSFPDPDPIVPIDASAGPWISSAYHWHLNAIAGDHLCLSVEISAPGSPYIIPSLLNNTPGWPTSDLLIINDNHKAQRNMHLSTTAGGMPSGGGAVTDYAIVHNGALIARDVTLRVGIPALSKRYARTVSLRTVGTEERGVAGPGQSLVLRGLQPGENRWVAVTVTAAGLPAGGSAYAIADDMVGNVAVNGFGAGMRAVPLPAAIHDSLASYRGVAMRLVAGFGAKASASDIELKLELSPADYVAFVNERLVPHLKSDLAQLRAFEGGDRFGLAASLGAVAERRSAPELVGEVATLLNGVGAYLTMVQLQEGDPADILQMVRWQKQLFQRDPRLVRMACASKLVSVSSAFLTARESRRVTNAAYPKLLAEVAGCLREAAGSKVEFTGESLAALEKQHRAYLLELSKRRG